MALTTTIGGASSDSYVSASDYAAYVVANIDASFAGEEAANELNLRRAAQYIDRRFQDAFHGMRQYEDQAREWPRLTNKLVRGWPIDPDTVPQGIKDAQMELAHQLQTGATNPFATIDAMVKRERVGALEVEYQGGLGEPRLVAVLDALRPYVAFTGSQVQMVRG